MPHSKKVQQSMKAVERAAERYAALEDRAASINDEKATIRADLKAAGISPKAFLEAYRFRRMADKSDRDAHDAGVALCREALGIQEPEQYDFDGLIRQNTAANDDAGSDNESDAPASHAAGAMH